MTNQELQQLEAELEAKNRYQRQVLRRSARFLVVMNSINILLGIWAAINPHNTAVFICGLLVCGTGIWGVSTNINYLKHSNGRMDNSKTKV